jgi:hypothetical protein
MARINRTERAALSCVNDRRQLGTWRTRVLVLPPMPKHLRQKIGQRDADHEKNGQTEVHCIIMAWPVRAILTQINHWPAHKKEARHRAGAWRASTLQGQTNPGHPARLRMQHSQKSATAGQKAASAAALK